MRNLIISLTLVPKLIFAGFNQTLASLNNSGTADFSGTGNTTLNIAGNYVGNGGLINMSGVLADDASVIQINC